MDLKALQTTLREFAAEREWQPFHTPKNLAMALMVEAADLAKIFQWMTPEQSESACGDLMLQEQVADEVADVLLYLVQIADHTGIDLKRAVGRKLVKNSKKHPPLRPGPPGFRVGKVAAAGDIETHVLVDWENVQPKDDDIRSLAPGVTDLWLFHGPNQKGLSARHASFGDKVKLVKIARTGKNALDFHLSFYMGYIAARHPDARFVVVSNDKGYAPMLEHAAELGFSARQVGFGKSGAVVEAASASSAVKKAAPAEKVAAKKVPTKPAAKKAVAKLPSSPVAKAQAKKVPAAKKAAATKKTASPAAAPTTASVASTSSAAPAFNVSSVIDLKKAISHVVASLRKTTSKPTKRAKLVAAIKSLLGQSADEQAVHSVLAQLLASGKVVIDSNGSVQYAFQSA